jgi:hypothetical protein
MANRRAVPPRTPKERLEKLPQFEPDYSISYHQISFEKRERHLFPPEREQRLRKVLTEFIGSHSRSVVWRGKPTSTDRFVENALRAIATFEHRRSAQPNFDRKAARELFKRTGARILDTCQDLEEISTNRERSQFLKRLYAAADRQDNAAFEAPERAPSKALKRLEAKALKQSEARSQSYLEISPDALALQLMKLHALVAVAAEKVELGAGDFQRDEIAQELCIELAIAWVSGTGKIPTVSKPSKTYRPNSPFLSLLALVNENIDQKFRHQTEFRNYATKARDEMRRQFPELVSQNRKPRGRN